MNEDLIKKKLKIKVKDEYDDPIELVGWINTLGPEGFYFLDIDDNMRWFKNDNVMEAEEYKDE